MSVELIDAVLKSSLPAWLRPYAIAYAWYASDDGTRCYPSITTIARRVKRSRRRTMVATQALRRLGVLQVITPGAPRRSTRHWFCAEALTAPLDPLAGCPPAKPAKSGLKSRYAQGDRKTAEQT